MAGQPGEANRRLLLRGEFDIARERDKARKARANEGIISGIVRSAIGQLAIFSRGRSRACSINRAGKRHALVAEMKRACERRAWRLVCTENATALVFTRYSLQLYLCLTLDKDL